MKQNTKITKLKIFIKEHITAVKHIQVLTFTSYVTLDEGLTLFMLCFPHAEGIDSRRLN